MAVQSPPKSARAVSPSSALPVHLALTASTPRRERLWNMLPAGLSIGLVSLIFWGPYAVPWAVALGIVGFFAYWLVRSYAVVVSCVVGLLRIRRFERTNWVAKYCEWLPQHLNNAAAKPWASPLHMVIIPNYKESEEELSRTLNSLAAQANARQVVVVMAMEAREAGSDVKATRLVSRYRQNFAEMFATFHPAGLPNETPGKGSNEAWAARDAHNRLIASGLYDISRFTVTSCDADAVFHPHHFEALNYLFLTAKDPYRTFWQPTIFNTNNIWDIPAPLRMPDGLSGINRLSNLVMPGSVKFPTSCYSLSWEMLHEVDYWDEEVIPEDWHVYLKCCFTLGDRVNVEALYLPLGNDCVLADGYMKTLKAHYTQSVRHAWGASDIPFAWRAAGNPDSPLSLKRKFLLSGAVTKVHALWMAQWYIITIGNVVPLMLTKYMGASLPDWFVGRAASLWGPSWHLDEIFKGEFSHPVGGTISLNIAGALVYFCLFPLIGLIVLELRIRGPRPAYFSRWKYLGQFAMWPLMAVITFFFASLPALHAQLKLARGKHLVYQVAEKSLRHHPAPVLAHQPALGHLEAAGDPVGAGGGD